MGDGGWMEPVSWGRGAVGRTPFKPGEKVKPLSTLCPFLPIISGGATPAVCVSMCMLCMCDRNLSRYASRREFVCVCARICVYRCVFGVCGVAGTMPGEYWGLGGHVGRASVVWSG